MKAKLNAEILLRYSTAYPFRLNGNMLLCVYCCEEYQHPADYRRHMEESHATFNVYTAFTHTKSMDYLKVDCTNLRCRECGVPCDGLEEIGRHIRDSHDNADIDLNYPIGMQPYRIDSDKWNCVLCDKKFPTITKLCRHTTSHYLKYTCDVCGRSYLTKEALAYHVRCSHASGSHVCRKCWGEFLTIQEKKEHTRASKSCWPFCCVLCGQRFMSWEAKQKHLVNTHGRPKRTYSCPDCGELYESRKLYYRHFTIKHTDDVFICACCGLKFPNQGMLDDHLLVHSNEKKFQCNVCSKGFTRKKSLTQHMWIHSETKRFQCIICDKQFAQKVSLKGHMKTHHPEVEIVFD